MREYKEFYALSYKFTSHVVWINYTRSKNDQRAEFSTVQYFDFSII
jgi:hypothetical protein